MHVIIEHKHCGSVKWLNMASFKRPSLVAAAFSDNLKEVKKLLDEGYPDVNEKDQLNRTALHYACAKGNYEMAEILLNLHLNPNDKGHYDETPLSLACWAGFANIVGLLLKYQANPYLCNRYCNYSLVHAASAGHLDVMSVLLNHGVDPNYIPPREAEMEPRLWCTSLHMAASRGDLNMIKLLAQHKVDLEIKDYEGNTALIRAAQNGNIDVLKYLISLGSNVCAKNNKGKTALIFIVRHNDVESIKYLIQMGCPMHSYVNKSPLKAFLNKAINRCCLYRFIELSEPVIEDVIPCCLINAGYKIYRDSTLLPLYYYIEERFDHMKQMVDEEDYIYISTVKEKLLPFFAWLESVSQQPQSLRALCRVTITEHIGSNLPLKIKELPIANGLKKFLSYEDL